MSFFCIDMAKLAKYAQVDESYLERMTLNEIRKLKSEMEAAEKEEKIRQNTSLPSYPDLIEKWFLPYAYLKQWFSKEEIVHACVQCGITKEDLTEVCPVRRGTSVLRPNAEYIDTAYTYLEKYDQQGHLLREREYCLCDRYLVKNPYQDLCHGKVFLYLLYQKMPYLIQYKFNAYGYSMEREYEIYPENHLYTPFRAIMERDPQAIIDRNIFYAQVYHHGEHTVEKTKQRIADNKQYLDRIQYGECA